MSGQPAFFGKYNSLEEAQKGWDNTVDELVKFKQLASDAQAALEATREQNTALTDIVNQLSQQHPQSPAPAAPQLVDDEGNLDVSNLLGAIDNQLAQVKQEMSQEVVQVVKEALSPVVNFQESKNTFVATKGDQDFNDGEFQKALTNPTFAKVFNTLLSNPETAKEAYSTVYDMWKANRPVPTTGSTETPESRARKEAAGSPDPLGGFPAAPPQAQGAEEIKKLSEMARGVQDLMNPDSQVAFAREFVKGGKLQKMLDSLKPDWEE
jgi:hypothetical protein